MAYALTVAYSPNFSSPIALLLLYLLYLITVQELHIDYKKTQILIIIRVSKRKLLV